MVTDPFIDTRNSIHASAFIDPSVIMGEGNVICEGVIIREGVQIGDHNYFGPYCIIGDYPEKVGFYDKLGKVLIGSGNRLTKQVTVDSGSIGVNFGLVCDETGVTIIKNNCTLLKNAHVGHDAFLHDGVTLSCNVCIGGFTEVGAGSNVGLGAVVHQRLKIPEGVMIAMNAAITKKTFLQPGRIYAGVPARDIGSNDKKRS